MIYDRNNLPEELLNLPASDFEALYREDIKDEKFQTKPVGFFKDAAIRLTKSKVSIIAFIIIGIIIILAIVVPPLSPYGFNDQNINAKYLPPKMPIVEKLGIMDGTRVLKSRKVSALTDPERYPEGSVIEYFNVVTVKGQEMCDVRIDAYKMAGVPDNEYHWFGTDYLGRDLLTRLFKGTRISLLIAFFSVLTNVFIGVVYGAISGYYGGKIDLILTHFAEVLDGMPYIVVTILFMILFGSGMVSIVLALTITGWIGTSRLIRAQFYRFKGREYVLAARTLGVSDRTLIFRHILPNCVGPLITRAMIAIPGAIFSESFLAYLGLGIKPPNPSIGVLLSDGQSVLLQYPYQTVFPAILISVLMIAFNLFSNGLRDALDPTKRGEE
ncbi:MAG: ABC transporter permease [Clostridia bacterium]|jgi:ABC-type dipeptide/oligopeptide/nickel transport systems, permease components|nr:ABC transporter permease [Clostridia bacterium]